MLTSILLVHFGKGGPQPFGNGLDLVARTSFGHRIDFELISKQGTCTVACDPGAIEVIYLNAEETVQSFRMSGLNSLATVMCQLSGQMQASSKKHTSD